MQPYSRRDFGKLVIIGIFVVALAAAAFSTWYHYRAGHRSLEFWGRDIAALIAYGAEIDAIALGGSTDNGSTDEREAIAADTPRRIQVRDRFCSVLATKDATNARGMSNVRRELVLDPTFDWQSTDEHTEPNWQFALRFREGQRATTVVFDFKSRAVTAVGLSKTARLDPAANDDIRAFFAEQFEE